MIDTHEWGTSLRIPCTGCTTRFVSVARLLAPSGIPAGRWHWVLGSRQGDDTVLYDSESSPVSPLFPKPDPAPVAESWSSR